MNFLNDLGKQIRDLFASMTPASRIMSGLMFAIVVLSLGWIMTGSGNGGTKYEFLFGGRPYEDAQLAAWEAAFGAAQLGDYVREGQRIKVPSLKKDQYLKALSTSNSMPMQHDGEVRKSLWDNNVFDPATLIEKRTTFARQHQLESIIKQQAGIQNAIVSYDEQRAGFGRKSDKVCTISVQGFNNTPVPPNLLRNLASLACSHFAGLSPENVTVTDMGTNTVVRGGSSDAEENPYFAAQTRWETMYENKISSLLSDFSAKVSVSVQLDPTLKTQTEQLQYQGQPVTVASSTLTKSSENTKPNPGGQPGAAPNGVSNQPTTLTSGSNAQNSKLKENQETQQSKAGHEAQVVTKAGLVPKSVNVSIGIPESHYRKVALQMFRLNNPDKADSVAPVPTETELATIKLEQEQAVRAAVDTIPVGVREGDDRKAYVKVYTYTDMPLAEAPVPSVSDNALAWLATSWSTVALIVLVLISFGMMFSFMRAPVNSGEAEKRFEEGFGLEMPAMPIDELDLGQTAGADGARQRARPAALELSGQEMKEDLSSIIKENPDAAVNLIKAWIGEAA
jgi:flagellar M-ring protein FliF